MMDYYIKSKNVIFLDKVVPAIIHIKDGIFNGILDYNEPKKAIDYGNQYIMPGLFDSHTHGFAGYSFTKTLKKEDVKKLMKFYASFGVTSILATASMSGYQTIVDTMNQDMPSRIIGIHAEGPFLNDKRFGAALPTTKFLKANISLLKEMIENSNNHIKMMTIAAELDQDLKVVKELRKHGINVAVGHSEISYERFMEIKDDIDLITHLANAMSGVHHREMGLLGAGLLTDKPCELICDGLHVTDPMLDLIFKNKNIDDIIMISDSTALSGLKAGSYQLHDYKMNVTEQGLVINEFNHLSGSSNSLLGGVKKMYHKKLPLEKCVQMASYNPAKIHKINNIGSIKIGNLADFVVLNNELEVIETYKEGCKVFDLNNDQLIINPKLEEVMGSKEFLNFYL